MGSGSRPAGVPLVFRLALPPRSPSAQPIAAAWTRTTPTSRASWRRASCRLNELPNQRRDAEKTSAEFFDVLAVGRLRTARGQQIPRARIDVDNDGLDVAGDRGRDATGGGHRLEVAHVVVHDLCELDAVG